MTIFDHRVFAIEMKMGDIKTNTSPWVFSRQINDLCAHYLSGNYLETNIFIQVSIVILSWINVHCSSERRKIYCSIMYYFLLLYSYNFNPIKNTHLRHVTVHYFSVLYNRKPYFFRIVHYVREVTR